MYSSIKKDSLVTAANAKALTETSETTSNTAIFNTTISQSDSDVNSSIHSKEKNNTKFSITEDMSEQERYEELKDKSIVVSKPDMSKVSAIDIEAYKNLSTKEAKKPIRRIAEMLGIHNVNYKNSNIKFDFAFSKGSLDTSLNHQREYGGSYTDYAEMLTCLEKLIENAELIEVHKNYKDNEQLKRTFVLMSALSGKDGIYPVQFEVKEFYSSTKKLYLTAVLTKIKEPAVVTESHTDYSEASTPLVADSDISLSQLFANVNPSDKRFLKYVPDNFLSAEQIEAKRKAQKSDYKNYNRYVEVFENDKNGSDNKFSLSEPVEEKGNLIAVHNIYTDKLVKSLKLGGFPMPSIAVIKSDMGHGNYGECSFVFDKSTIDPKADKRNKVYGGDAWTPTYPAIEYKASEDVIQRVKDTREHNLFGNDGTFMHCSGSTFFLRQRRLFRLRLRLLPELHRFSLRYLRVCSAFRQRPRWCRRLFLWNWRSPLLHLRIRQSPCQLFQGRCLVGTKLTINAVRSRLRIVQLYLPVLGAAVVLAK